MEILKLIDITSENKRETQVQNKKNQKGNGWETAEKCQNRFEYKTHFGVFRFRIPLRQTP